MKVQDMMQKPLQDLLPAMEASKVAISADKDGNIYKVSIDYIPKEELSNGREEKTHLG